VLPISMPSAPESVAVIGSSWLHIEDSSYGAGHGVGSSTNWRDDNLHYLLGSHRHVLVSIILLGQTTMSFKMTWICCSGTELLCLFQLDIVQVVYFNDIAEGRKKGRDIYQRMTGLLYPSHFLVSFPRANNMLAVYFTSIQNIVLWRFDLN